MVAGSRGPQAATGASGMGREEVAEALGRRSPFLFLSFLFFFSVLVFIYPIRIQFCFKFKPQLNAQYKLLHEMHDLNLFSLSLFLKYLFKGSMLHKYFTNNTLIKINPNFISPRLLTLILYCKGLQGGHRWNHFARYRVFGLRFTSLVRLLAPLFYVLSGFLGSPTITPFVAWLELERRRRLLAATFVLVDKGGGSGHVLQLKRRRQD